MPTGAKKGYGAVVETGDTASPPVYTALSEVTGINDISQIRPLLNVTNMDSANETEEFIPALKTGSAIEITCNDTGHASQVALETKALAGNTVPFRVRFTQFSPIRIKTFLIALSGILRPDIAPGTALTVVFVGQISGDITTS